MIKITFPVPDTTIWKRWRRDCQQAATKLADAVAQGNPPVVSDIYRRKSIKVGVYFHKQGPFHGKCAYCECYVTDFQHGDMEHFRPKLAVTDENDVPISAANSADKSRHIRATIGLPTTGGTCCRLARTVISPTRSMAKRSASTTVSQ